jgi:threonine/homoserine/homoserine lactone efflux protein
MFWILIAVSIIMVIFAAFQYATAGDDTEKTTKGRKTLTWAAVGIAVALLAKGLPTLVGNIYGVSNATGLAACAAF